MVINNCLDLSLVFCFKLLLPNQNMWNILSHEPGTERAISLIQVCVCVELLKRSKTCTHVISAVFIYLFIYSWIYGT